MKKITPAICLMALIVFAASAKAEDEEQNTGFSGRLESGLGVMISNSRVTAFSDEMAKIDRREGTGKQYGMITPFLLGDCYYTFENGLQVYVSSPFFDDPREGPSLGLAKVFQDNSSLDCYLYGNSVDVWENPFLTSAARKLTAMSSGGFVLNYKDIRGTGLTLNYKFKATEVDQDAIGEIDPTLRRAGVSHTLGLGYRLTLDMLNTVTPGIWYARNHIYGAANSSHEYISGLEYTRETDQYRLNMITLLSRSLYDRTHAVFMSKRSDWGYAAVGSLIWYDLFGREHWYTEAGISYTETSSNIDFYDERNFILGLAVGYFFY